jgi:hypothetical protein
MSALSTPTHRDGSQKQKGKRVELTQMTKSQGKAKMGSFEMRKLGPQGHGQRLDATKQNTTSPQEEPMTSALRVSSSNHSTHIIMNRT